MLLRVHARIVVGSLLLLGALFACEARAGGEGWLTDVEAAKKQAAKEKKDLLFDFTGSDWCGWCIRLSKEVFDTEAFKKEAPKHFVLVELDFPSDQSKLTEETKKQNQEWMQKLGVEGFPTIFLVDAKGLPYAQTGYQPGGAEKYLDHLGELRKVRERRDEAFSKAEKAEGVEKAKHIDAALEAVGETLAFASYRDHLEEIIELDGRNDAGLKAKYEEKLAVADVRRQVAELEQTYDGANAEEILGRLSKLEAEHAGRGKVQVEIGRFKVNVLRTVDKNDEAVKLLDDLLKVKGIEPITRVELAMQKADLLRQAEKMDEVLKVFDFIVADEEVPAEIRVQLKAQRARTLAEVGRVDEAAKSIDDLAAAATDSDQKLRLFVTKAQFLARAGRKEEAAKAFESAVDAAENDEIKAQLREFRSQILDQEG